MRLTGGRGKMKYEKVIDGDLDHHTSCLFKLKIGMHRQIASSFVPIGNYGNVLLLLLIKLLLKFLQLC